VGQQRTVEKRRGTLPGWDRLWGMRGCELGTVVGVGTWACFYCVVVRP
jgi:hypothetical protein